MKRYVIGFELNNRDSYDGFFRRVEALGAVPLMKSEWVLMTRLTASEIERDLRRFVDPADRLLVVPVGVASSQNLINRDRMLG